MSKQITVYTLSELAKNVRERVITNFRYTDSELQDIIRDALQDVVDSEKEHLESIGFSDVSIAWQLGYVQSDHVTIKARMYQDELLNFFGGESMIDHYDDLRKVEFIELEVNNYRQISWDVSPESLYDENGELTVNVMHFKHVLKEFLKDAAVSLYDSLRDEAEDLTSDDYIAIHIQDTGRMFTENGIAV